MKAEKVIISEKERLAKQTEGKDSSGLVGFFENLLISTLFGIFGTIPGVLAGLLVGMLFSSIIK